MAVRIRKSDNATLYTCKRGWLITMDEEGGYLPFFVKVRNEDIIWDNEDQIKMFKTVTGKLQRMGYSYSSKYINPQLQLRIESNGWIYNINPDKTFSASYVGKVKPSDVIIHRNSERHIISADFFVPLPINIIKGKTAILGNFEPLGTSIIQYTGGRRYVYSNNNEYDSIVVKIYPSYDENVYAEHNSEIIEDFCNGNSNRILNIYLQGVIT